MQISGRPEVHQTMNLMQNRLEELVALVALAQIQHQSQKQLQLHPLTSATCLGTDYETLRMELHINVKSQKQHCDKPLYWLDVFEWHGHWILLCPLQVNTLHCEHIDYYDPLLLCQLCGTSNFWWKDKTI